MRISNKLIREIDTTLRRFNAKVRRLERQGKEDIIIPERVTKKELLNYETTSDIRRRLRSLSRFSRRGAEKSLKLDDGEYVSIWEKKEHDILKRTAQAKLTREIKYMETHRPRVYGKVQDVSFAKTGDETYLRLISERNRLKTKGLMNRRQLERENKIAERILYQRNRQFRENYYKMLDDIGSMLGQKEKADQIKDQLDKLSDKEFVDFFNEDKGLNAITYFYQTIEDGIFYVNYDYIKNNFDLMAEHLEDNESIAYYKQLGSTKVGDTYNYVDNLTYSNKVKDNVSNSKRMSKRYIQDQNKYTSTQRKVPKRYTSKPVKHRKKR